MMSMKLAEMRETSKNELLVMAMSSSKNGMR